MKSSYLANKLVTQKKTSDSGKSCNACIILRQKALFLDDTLPVLKTAEKFGIRHLFTILQPSSLKSKRQPQDLEYKALDQLTELLSILNQIDRKDNDVKIA